MSQSRLTSATESLLNEFADRRGMSKRAKKEFQAGLQGKQWIQGMSASFSQKETLDFLLLVTEPIVEMRWQLNR